MVNEPMFRIFFGRGLETELLENGMMEAETSEALNETLRFRDTTILDRR